MKLVKIELALWFMLIATILTGCATLRSDSRSYMQANSELNGVVRTEIDELDGGN